MLVVLLLVTSVVTVFAQTSWGTSVVPLPTQSYAEVARDSYQRDVSNGLGTADIGGSYRTSYASGVGVSVSAGRAQITSLPPGGWLHAELPGVHAADVMTSVVITAPDTSSNSAGFYYGVDLRTQGSGAKYRAKVKIASGHLGLRLARVGSGLDRTLASLAVADKVEGGDTVVMQAQVTGSSTPALAVRAWLDGNPPPAWQLQYADQSGDAITHDGWIGTWAYESSGGASTSFEQSELRGWALGSGASPSPGPTPAPTPTPTPTASPSSSPSSPSSSSSSSPPSTPSSSSQPTSSPPPPPSGGTSDGRGAAPIGTASYLLPANALIVSPSGSDSGAGTVSSPLRTVAAAVAKAAPGQVIALRAGTYHETVAISKNGITIQAYPKEAVWFDGTAQISGWTPSGTTWVHAGWNAQFGHSESFTAGQSSPYGWTFVGSQNPMAAWPDAVWLDGQQLTQVGSASAVKAGTFYVDYGSHTLVVGSNPSGHDVRASDLDQAFKVLAQGVTLQGFGVRRYATSLPELGTVRMQGGNNTVRDLVVTENATQGISFRDSNNLVDHVTSTDNGMVGVHANQADHLTIRNSVIDANNAQRFNAAPCAAGVKITRSRNLTIVNNEFADNLANGLWFDMADVGFVVANNTFRDNLTGAELELADTGIVANNVFDGGTYGLYIYDTGNVKVFNNSFTNNAVGSIFMSQDARRQSNSNDYNSMGDKRYPMGDPTDPWLLRNINVANNLFIRSSHGGMFEVYALDKATNIPADKMNLRISGNEFTYRDTSAQPSMVGWGGGDNKTVIRYETPDALAAAKNSSWTNIQDGAGGVARLAKQDVPTPLPSDVATAVGQVTGALHIGPF